MLKKITNISGGGFHLPGDDIDTDRIIPARFLKCVTFEGLGDHVFEDDRAQLAGQHPFDNERNKGRNILVVDENFGSGSSREHAVPALTQWGIQAVIGLSFAAIFRGNAVGNGLVCVTVEKGVHEWIVQQMVHGDIENVYIDLETMTIVIRNSMCSHVQSCVMPDSHRENLMTGAWDDIATCLDAGSAIEETAARLPYFEIPVLMPAA
jgi:3-isopropylmalate/(R)-2-methylmalate dehydratase small subunit